MAMRFVLTVAIFQLAIWGCYAVNGIIWHKQHQEFVQLFSISQFAALQKENLAKRRAIEMPDMSGEVVKAVYYEVKNFQHFKHILKSLIYSFSSAKCYKLFKE